MKNNFEHSGQLVDNKAADEINHIKSPRLRGLRHLVQAAVLAALVSGPPILFHGEDVLAADVDPKLEKIKKDKEVVKLAIFTTLRDYLLSQDKSVDVFSSNWDEAFDPIGVPLWNGSLLAFVSNSDARNWYFALNRHWLLERLNISSDEFSSCFARAKSEIDLNDAMPHYRKYVRDDGTLSYLEHRYDPYHPFPSYDAIYSGLKSPFERRIAEQERIIQRISEIGRDGLRAEAEGRLTALPALGVSNVYAARAQREQEAHREGERERELKERGSHLDESQRKALESVQDRTVTLYGVTRAGEALRRVDTPSPLGAAAVARGRFYRHADRQDPPLSAIIGPLGSHRIFSTNAYGLDQEGRKTVELFNDVGVAFRDILVETLRENFLITEINGLAVPSNYESAALAIGGAWNATLYQIEKRRYSEERISGTPRLSDIPALVVGKIIINLLAGFYPNENPYTFYEARTSLANDYKHIPEVTNAVDNERIALDDALEALQRVELTLERLNNVDMGKDDEPLRTGRIYPGGRPPTGAEILRGSLQSSLSYTEKARTSFQEAVLSRERLRMLIERHEALDQTNPSNAQLLAQERSALQALETIGVIERIQYLLGSQPFKKAIVDIQAALEKLPMPESEAATPTPEPEPTPKPKEETRKRTEQDDQPF